MTAAARRRMTADEFLNWALTQEETYELVDGVPVAKFRSGPESMANGTRSHAQVSGNIYFALRRRLRGGPCRPYTDDLSVRTSIERVRRPDVLVECGRGNGGDLEATAPTVLFEVLSPSSQREDLVLKPLEYKRIETVKLYAAVYTDVALLKVWARDEEGRWLDDVVSGLQANLPLPMLGIDLPLSEIYEEIELDSLIAL